MLIMSLVGLYGRFSALTSTSGRQWALFGANGRAFAVGGFQCWPPEVLEGSSTRGRGATQLLGEIAPRSWGAEGLARVGGGPVVRGFDV